MPKKRKANAKKRLKQQEEGKLRRYRKGLKKQIQKHIKDKNYALVNLLLAKYRASGGKL